MDDNGPVIGLDVVANLAYKRQKRRRLLRNAVIRPNDEVILLDSASASFIRFFTKLQVSIKSKFTNIYFYV